MARDRPYLFSLNGGEVSTDALGRVDLKRMAITAQVMTNWFPRVIGPMQFRPGLGYGGTTPSNAKARDIPFVFSADDTALIELSDEAMQIVIAGTTLARVAVSTVVTNGDFSSATGWTLTTTINGVATISGGVLTLRTPTRGGTNLARRSVTVAGADLNKEHGLRIVVTRGPVTFRCGSTAGGDEYIRETELNTGTYSLTLTPTGDFFVQFSAKSEINRIVDSITIEAAGNVTLPAPWAEDDLRYLRWAQSGDVVFVTNTLTTYPPMRIERRSARAWGISDYEFTDGPFKEKSAVATRLRVNAQNGNTTMESDKPFFRAEHVGQIFRVFSTETSCTNSLGGDDEYGDTLRVIGFGDTQRNITYGVTGTWTGTLTIQTSYDEGENWVRWRQVTINTFNTAAGPSDVPVLLRWGFLGNDHISGSATVTLRYTDGGGGGWGVVRVTSIDNTQQAQVEVLSRIHATVYSRDWEECRYSDLSGWPSVVELFEGRLWFLNKDKLCGTISDNFSSFDLEEEGDSGPIIRSIANGPVNKGLWMLGLARLVMGTIGAEPVGRSSSFDEPITPENFSIKDASTQGSADVAAVKIDRSGIFIQRSGKRAYLVAFSIDDQDYSSDDISKYNPDILEATVVGIAVQRQPDTRVWFWLDDGTAAMLVLEKKEDVIAWCRFTTDGIIEDISVLPNVEADDVYMIVQRDVGGVVRYREKLAYDTQAEGGDENYMADSYVTQALVASSVMTNLTHLIGQDVVVWINENPILAAVDSEGLQEAMTFTVDGVGQINLGQAYTGTAVAGLPYIGQWQSSKLAYAAMAGTAISQKKQVLGVQPVLANTHSKGIRFGQTFTKMVGLPEKYREVATGSAVLEEWDDDQFAIPGEWSNDARVCIEAKSPMPAKVLAMVLKMETHENG